MKISVLIFLFLITFHASSEEVQTTKRVPLASEQKELDILLKTTEISAAEAKEINEVAEATVTLMKNTVYSSFDYSEESVGKLSIFIDKISPQIPENKKEGLAAVWGSYLGNAIIQNYQGSWVKMGDGSFAVSLPNGNYLFPMKRVYKQMENGHEDSILVLFKSVNQINEMNKIP